MSLSRSSPLVGCNVDERDGAGAAAATLVSRRYAGALVAARDADEPLAVGSLVLIEARPDILKRHPRDFALARVVPHSTPPRASRAYDAFRCWTALVVMLGMIMLFSLNILTLLEASLLATGILIATQCLTIEQAFAAIKGRDLVAIVAAYGVGAALGNTEVASTLADKVCVLGKSLGAPGLLALVYLVTALLGSIMSNQAVVILLYPIFKRVADSQDLVSMRQLVDVLIIGSSSSFLTPFSYQTNLRGARVPDTSERERAEDENSRQYCTSVVARSFCRAMAATTSIPKFPTLFDRARNHPPSRVRPASARPRRLVQHYYEFSDFLRIGSGLTLLLCVATSVLCVTIVH